tara:strand:+ start:744 stop:968 length:225 start_codon:yes stop_codon:yes gene_type:complete
MTAKEKAEELRRKFFNVNDEKQANKGTNPFISIGYAKQCALICVDRMLDLFEDTDGADYRENELQEVKQEINKL